MENSIGGQIRRYIAVGVFSIAAVFGGVVTGLSFASPADGWDPVAPTVQAPVEPAAPVAPVAPSIPSRTSVEG